jgi:uncharacterized repeat protein (TIGR01451 family)
VDSNDGRYIAAFVFGHAFQAGERMTIQASPPVIGPTPTVLRLNGTDPVGNTIAASTGFPGTLVFDFPLTGSYPSISWGVYTGPGPADYAGNVDFSVTCASIPTAGPQAPPRELPGKPAANAGTPADVAIVAEGLSPAPSVGGTATLTVTATNKGPKPASDAFIKDVLPDGLRFVACTSLVDGVASGFCSWDGKNTVIDNLGTLKSGSTVTLTIGVAATKAGAGLKNTVGVGADEWDPDWSNNFTSIPVTISG